MTKNKKPNLILELEKIYNITLKKIDDMDYNGYMLDEENSVIGLNLSNNQISEIKT